MNINPENKDALSGSLFTGGNSPPANPIGYNGSPLAASQMGLELEVNSALALRAWGTEGRSREETVPEKLTLEGFYDFKKLGYRVYPLKKTLPLVITEGDCNFIKIVGLVEIRRLTVEPGFDNKIITTGTFKFLSEIPEHWNDPQAKVSLLQLVRV